MHYLVAIVAFAFQASVANAQCYDVFAWISHSTLDYTAYNWDIIKTVGFFGDLNGIPGLREYAHDRGVKLVKGSSMNEEDMNNATARKEWIDNEIEQALLNGYDGINLDYEGDKPEYIDGYNSLVLETAAAFHEQIPGSEVSIDAPIYPQFEGRNYDYVAIAEATDYIFIMAYDGEFWNNVQCIAPSTGANCSLACAAYDEVEYGVAAFIDMGVPASKLYLGYPWYGLKYEYVAGIPFFTGQLKYSEVINAIASQPNGKTTYDEASKTWIFHCDGFCFEDDRTVEIWFDDAATLAPKYALSEKYGLKGVGMWEGDYADASGHLDDMWGALCVGTSRKQ